MDERLLALLSGACVAVLPACGGDLCAEAEDEGLRGSDGRNYCELVDIVSDSDLSGTYQGLLRECLAEEEDARDREALLEAFSGASDAELEDLLMEHLEQCETWREYWEDNDVH